MKLFSNLYLAKFFNTSEPFFRIFLSQGLKYIEDIRQNHSGDTLFALYYYFLFLFSVVL